jgi:hypothetical protein
VVDTAASPNSYGTKEAHVTLTTITFQGRKIRLSRRVLESLQYALTYPKIYHDIGTDKASVKAIQRLKEEGLGQILEYSNQYLIKP